MPVYFIAIATVIFSELPLQKKVMDFDFTDFKSEETIIYFMLIAIGILKKHLHKQTLLFDDPEEVQRVRIKS